MTDVITIEQAAQLVAEGDETPETLAAKYGGEIIDGAWVPAGAPINADDGNYRIEYSDCTPREAAEQYVADGDWGDVDSTAWIEVVTWRDGVDADGDIVHIDEESHSVTIEAQEPECEAGHEHDWRSPHSVVGGIEDNPGVWGHGGGVIITEVCAHCGAYRETDTWAQNPANGVQGLRSVEYREADEDSLAWVSRRTARPRIIAWRATKAAADVAAHVRAVLDLPPDADVEADDDGDISVDGEWLRAADLARVADAI